jgi:hypothetical protein
LNGNSTCVAIRAASTEAEVMSAVRDYLSSLSPDKVAILPPTLVTLGIDYAKDIAQAALELARHEALAVADAPQAAFLNDAATVLSTAAMRLAVLSVGMESSTQTR